MLFLYRCNSLMVHILERRKMDKLYISVALYCIFNCYLSIFTIAFDILFFSDLYDWSLLDSQLLQAPLTLQARSGTKVTCNNKKLALFRYGEKLFAIDERCPHLGTTNQNISLNQFLFCLTKGFFLDLWRNHIQLSCCTINSRKYAHIV